MEPMLVICFDAGLHFCSQKLHFLLLQTHLVISDPYGYFLHACSNIDESMQLWPYFNLVRGLSTSLMSHSSMPHFSFSFNF